MRCIVLASAKVAVGAYGHTYSPTATLGYDFWARYLDVYDKLILVVRDGAMQPQSHMPRVDGPGIYVRTVPNYSSAVRMVLSAFMASKELVCALRSAPTAVHLRIPSLLGFFVWPLLRVVNYPYGVEVVGDPAESFGRNSYNGKGGVLVRSTLPWLQRRVVSNARAAAFVTQYRLQCKYPPSHSAYTTEFSSIALRREDVVSGRSVKQGRGLAGKRLVFVGGLDQPRKGLDTLLEALRILKDKGEVPNLTVIGSGKQLPRLMQSAERMGLTNIEFLGHVADHRTIIKVLDSSDLFVLPTRGEGLPRALLEAMARGLPCVGTAVSGVPEVLPSRCLVPADSPDALGKRISSLLRDPEQLQQLSLEAVRCAESFLDEKLRPRRVEFYRTIRDLTNRGALAGFRRIRGVL